MEVKSKNEDTSYQMPNPRGQFRLFHPASDGKKADLTNCSPIQSHLMFLSQMFLSNVKLETPSSNNKQTYEKNQPVIFFQCFFPHPSPAYVPVMFQNICQNFLFADTQLAEDVMKKINGLNKQIILGTPEQLDLEIESVDKSMDQLPAKTVSNFDPVLSFGDTESQIGGKLDISMP